MNGTKIKNWGKKGSLSLALAAAIGLSATTAQAVLITGDFTGSWYDPALNGQGFNIQVIPGNGQQQVLAYWYTYDAVGNPVWAFGTGPVNGNQATLDMVSARGPQFGPGFNPSDVEVTDFATVTLSFDSCGDGQVDWTSNDATIGDGQMDITRLTRTSDSVCTGGISDNTRQTDDFIEFRVFLDNSGVVPAASAHADYEQRPNRTDFSVEIEDVPEGSYDLYVAGEVRAQIEVISVPGGTEGEVEFSSPADDGHLLLDFEPLGESIEIAQNDLTLFTGTVQPNDNGGGGGGGGGGSCDGQDCAPPFGSAEYEIDLINTGLDDDANGDARLRQRDDRVDFKVEIEDLAEGFYELWVGGTLRAEIEVLMTPNGTEGEVEFRNPVEPGKLELNFDPRGELISIEQAGMVYLEGDFPLEPTDDDNGGGGGDDDDDDDDNGGGGDDDDNGGSGGSGGGGDDEIEVDLINTGLDSDASGDAEYESRPDRVEFKVEVEDLDLGFYDLRVGSDIVAQIEVLAVNGGTEGEVEFRDPVEPGHLLLDFDPRGQTINVEQDGDVYLTVDFPQ